MKTAKKPINQIPTRSLAIVLLFTHGCWNLADAQSLNPVVETLSEDQQRRVTFLNPKYLVFSPVFLPDDEKPGQKIPLVVYLHGAGGVGDDATKNTSRARVLIKGIHRFNKSPCLVVAPQCRRTSSKNDERGVWLPDDLDLFLHHLKAAHPEIDAERIYLTGNSMGGYGCWVWGGHHPEHLAAIAPIVGGIGRKGPKDVTPDLDQWAVNLAKVPVYAFAGAKDRVVPAERSERMVAAIRKAGGTRAKIKIYPEEGHGASKAVFSSAEYFHWMFSQRRSSPTASKPIPTEGADVADELGRRTETLLTTPLKELTKPIVQVGDRPNVLFISVDDWNDWVGCLGNKQARTPNVDRLASRGLLFTNAHCVAPVCNPSRVATLTGLRPATTGVYENGGRMRRKLPDLVTLPQYFRQQGYHVVGGGKVFHDVPPHCDDPASWDEYFWWNEHGPMGGRFGGSWRSPYSIPPDPQLAGRPIHRITKLTKRNFEWGAVDQPESDWPDSKVAAWATEFLSHEHTKPFFLAVGIFRPHVPWFNPRKYVEKYPLDRISLPTAKGDDLDDLGPWAKKRALDRNSKHEQLVEAGEWKPAVQAYLASISFADANVGRVLEALNKSAYRDNTIVVFWSDHGYHLGEKGHWHKRTLWERSTRVPFVIAAPNVTKPGTSCSRAVSLLDIYPTLVSLCGLKERPELEGHDLTSLLKMPESEWSHAAVTTWNPGNYSVRSERWRYIRYATGEEELYDHETDPNEWHNLAANATYAETKRRLARHLSASVRSESRQD